ncbi:oxygenase MpaB family protein [Streptomyces sp. NPDC093085]|uniref:oxygenase MpaB family protein n=1 Tax=Streptomyces sp. NPDC093085 TaxID=3155068 RepID=UPI00341A5C68
MTEIREISGAGGAGGPEGAPRQPADRAPVDAFGRLVLETMPEESKLGLSLGFIRTFAVPDIARVLAATGRMTSAPRVRAKATGVAMFTLIGRGVDSDEGRPIVEELRRVHERPGITPELMRYVLACFTVCPLRFIDDHGHRPATPEERSAAYAFHVGLSDALGITDITDTTGDPDAGAASGLAGVERWMRAFEERNFAPSPEGDALWAATSTGLLGRRLPRPLAGLAPAVAASLLDAPLREALRIRRAPAPVRALMSLALRARAAARRRRT